MRTIGRIIKNDILPETDVTNPPESENKELHEQQNEEPESKAPKKKSPKAKKDPDNGAD